MFVGVPSSAKLHLKDCSPELIECCMDEPFVVCADVWNTEFRVSLVQPIQLPFTVHSPLKQQDSQRRLLVTRGENSLPCVLEQQADICTVNFQDFPADTLTSPDPATLQYYDSSLPQDTVDTRPVPYVAIASLVPAGAL